MTDTQDDILLLAVALSSAALASFIEDENVHKEAPQERFIRPCLSYVAFLNLQQDLLPDGGNRIIYDTFRMGAHELEQLICMSSKYISRHLPQKQVVCVALHWLASGASAGAQEQFFLDPSYSTIHHYRHIGMNALLRALTENGFYGGDINESSRIKKSSAQFEAQEPSLKGCVGAIDGTHVPIVVSKALADRYRNRKGMTSTNVLGVVDWDGSFLAVYPGAEGCASDVFVLSHCTEFLSKIPANCFYLGDAGYGLTMNILTPYRSTRYHLREWADEGDGRPNNPREIFNYRHSKSRIIVEQAFGMLKRKWTILGKPLELELNAACRVIHTCCALHNYVIACKSSVVESEDTNPDIDDIDDDIPASLSQLYEIEDRMHTRATAWRDSISQELWTSFNSL
ncbi:hypothetical protein Ae201684_012952 [Aphanomyces euteiches]|uniref:DDE Tnp4 domain-containing protein n=1 Tax=Aphanomyces euteiches TaxID=100861 RepID=A0A6G0WPY2_9STRA|nr:hypothetical protein Ae201684_012952 [Aphanomyces euteiches]KAH9131666.1 hypothetical protein AeRB84_021687 [Aphanomyces euteiches]